MDITCIIAIACEAPVIFFFYIHHILFVKAERHYFALRNPVSVKNKMLTLKVLVTTIDARWEGMGDVGSARYEPALLPPCPAIRVLNYSN